MTPIRVRVRVPRGLGGDGFPLTASWQAGQVTCVVGADGPRRDAVLLLLAALLELPHRLLRVDPHLLRVAPVTFAAHEAQRMLGYELARAVTWRNPARAEWGSLSLCLWGIGCDYLPLDHEEAPRGVLCSSSGGLFLGSPQTPLVGILSQGLLCAPRVESWTPEAHAVVARHLDSGGRLVVSGRQVPSFLRQHSDLREVLVPTRDRAAVAR